MSRRWRAVHSLKQSSSRAQRGDERAFETLIRPYEEIAFRVAYLITSGAAEAEDAVQDGFVNAWRAL